MITDNDIIQIFTKNNKIIPAHIKNVFILKLNDDVLNYLKNRYIDIPLDVFTYKEVIWRILKNINIRPKCKCQYCNNNVKFIGKDSWDLYGRTINGYNKYCSDGCANKDIIKLKHLVETLLLHYGVINPAKSDIIRLKIINTQKNTPNFWENIVQKRLKTCLKKYGVLNYTLTDIFREKFKLTCLKKYGVTNPLKSDIIKEKIKLTCLTRYNCSNGGMSLKAIGTFKLHKTFNSSSAERKLYLLIKDLYKNTIYLYTSEEYPYMCDFYIPELDLYIEYLGSMFHNKHLFRDTEEDNKLLDNIKMKALEMGRYKSLIEQWTIRDIKKYNIACNNKLNYLLIYPKWNDNWYSYLYNKNTDRYIEILHNSLLIILNKYNNNTNLLIIIGES